MIEMQTTCRTCGESWTPAHAAYVRGTWRTCTHCRGDPGDDVSGIIEPHPKPLQSINGPKCQAERNNTMTTAETRKERIHELRNEGVAVPASVYAAMASDRVPEDLLRSWGWSAHLWDRPTAQAYAGLEGALPSLQEAWDLANESIAGSLELRGERTRQVAQEQRQREAEDAALRASEADQVKAELRERFLRLPGTTESEFEAEYPTLLSDRRRVEMQRSDDDARHELQRLVRAGL